MPLARISSKILFFAHIPKTGGSSVEAYLERKGSLALCFGRRLGWSATTAQHMDARLHARLVPRAFYDHGFAIVRDPVARMVSEYRYRVDRYPGQRAFPDWVRAAFDAYQSDPYVYDNHIRPQTEFLLPDMALFRFEEGLDRAFDWIDTVTDTPPADRRVWKKQSRAAHAVVPDDLASEIAQFYAEDYRLLRDLKGADDAPEAI